MDNHDLGILISGGMDITKTVAQINSDLKTLTQQVSSLSLNIDTSKMVKDIESQMGKVKQVTERSLSIDSSSFTKEGNKFISSIKELEKQHNGMTQSVVKNTGVVENKYGQLEEQLKNYLVTVKTADNEIKKIRLSPQTDAITGKTSLQPTDIQTINNSKQARQEYINWWDRALSQQRQKEVVAQERANQKLIDDNYKMIVKRREDEERLANQIGALREQSMSRVAREEDKLAKTQAQYANRAMENTKKQVEEEKKKTDELDRYIKKQQDLARRQSQELRASRGDVLTSDQNKQIDDYVRSMNEINTTTPEARRKIDDLRTGFRNIQSDAKVASQNVSSFASNLEESFRRIPVWAIGMTASKKNTVNKLCELLETP